MNKEQLIALGLTEEQAEKVATAHKDAIDGNYVPKDRFNEINTENKQLKESLKERDGQIDALKTESGASEKLKQQITELQAANQQKDKEHAAEMKRIKRETLDERLLMEAGAIDPLAVKPFLAAIDDTVDDEGYAAVRAEQINALVKTESKKFLLYDTAKAKFD